ncbi:MAG TPA: NrpR regulatory domain-containing protein [Candidatus Hydrogenedentes bacterium]|nr:NrpR regulatory domain-containing protein [Candidatus Hydrogenedentota bacterium]
MHDSISDIRLREGTQDCAKHCRDGKEDSALDIKTRRKMIAILRVLQAAPKPMGSQRIAEALLASGIDLGERTVRNYLAQTDGLAWTENLGRRGRRLTPHGLQELESALVVDKVGFVAARVDMLAYQMDFDITTRKGKVIINVSTFNPRDWRFASRVLTEAYDAGLSMGRLVAFGGPGDSLGTFNVPKGSVAVGTVCSVSINGIFLRAKIATTSRFGGLVQLEKMQPRRFTQIITYDGSSLDPLEIFIRGHMTSVMNTARTGFGVVGASFREVPSIAMEDVRRLVRQSEQAGLGGLLAIGTPNQPLLDIPVAQGRTGLVICGGLNPIAAVVESGISVTSTAMCTLCEFDDLVDYTDLRSFAAKRGL